MLFAIYIVLVPTLALGQQAPATDAPSARCLLAGKTFSPGATIGGAGGIMACSADGAWVASDKPASGCFLADNFYSVGATSGVSNTKALVETCAADGSWSTTAAKDAP
jgi:hypothetical protein